MDITLTRTPTDEMDFLDMLEQAAGDTVTVERLRFDNRDLMTARNIYERVWVRELNDNPWKKDPRRKNILFSTFNGHIVFLMFNAVPECLPLLDNITICSDLRALIIKNCGLNAIPDSITELSGLTYLEIVNDVCPPENKLTSVPESIAKLTQLEILILHGNNLRRLPSSIETLKSLWWINVAYNEKFYAREGVLPDFLCNNSYIVFNLANTPYEFKKCHRPQTSRQVEQLGESGDVFISYSSAQTKLAEQLYDYLLELNVECWLAPKSIPIGAIWEEEFSKAVEKSKILILICSVEAYSSKYVRQEVHIALQKGNDIIPIVTDNSDPGKYIPELEKYEHLDVDETSLKSSIYRIHDSIKTFIQRRNKQ